MKERLNETESQIAHYESVLSNYGTDEIREQFEALDPSKHHQWTMDAIAELDAGGSNECYIAKVTLVHLYEAEQKEEVYA